jgi:CubicO group peptidase (beta-lactamase class C family)
VVEVQGTVNPTFERVADAFAANFVDNREVGAACAVYVGGEPVVDIWGGSAEIEQQRAWEQDTLVCVFSTTKGVAAVCANQLIELGRLDPEAPIAEYWPEFAANGKASIPVKWALSHRAGLADLQAALTLDEVAAWDPVVEAIAAAPPVWEPGTKHGYHSLTYGWIVGEIIRRVTGRSLGQYFADAVAVPLGLDCYVGAPPELDDRIARIYPDNKTRALLDAAFADQSTLLGRVMSGPSCLFGWNAMWDSDMWNTRRMRGAEVPSTNGHSDARSLARMYAACVGEVDGVRLLSGETVVRAGAVLSDGTDCVSGTQMTFGLGFMLAPMFPEGVGPRTFGHYGAGGSTAFADPDRGVGFCYAMNQMDMIDNSRAEALVAATYQALA